MSHMYSLYCIIVLYVLWKLVRDMMVDFACTDAFVFTGTNLGFGDGDLTKLKWSMDLKQRFTEVIHFLFILTKV